MPLGFINFHQREPFVPLSNAHRCSQFTDVHTIKASGINQLIRERAIKVRFGFFIFCDGSIMDMKEKEKEKKKKKVTLISSNGMIFEDVDLDMLSECRVIKARIEKAMCEEEQKEGGGGGDDDEMIILRVPEITGKILGLVLEYCSKYTNDEDLKRWETKLATEVDEATLAHLIMAADYLDMWELLTLAGTVMSSKEKTPFEIVEIFHRKLDSEEEEASRAKLWP